MNRPESIKQLIEILKRFAGVWIKANERLPNDIDWYFVKGEYFGTLWYNGHHFKFFDQTPLGDHMYKHIEWLDTSKPIKEQILFLLESLKDFTETLPEN